jgi:hypothetical protein
VMERFFRSLKGHLKIMAAGSGRRSSM